MLSARFFLTQSSSRAFSTSASARWKEVVIVSAARTPVGSFRGSLASVAATRLGSIAIEGVLNKANLDPKLVEDVIMGNVCSAGLGQAPARQALVGAGIPYSCEATTVNKVCASGMKAITFAAQSIMLGHRDIMIAGGMESMSNTPYYMKRKSLELGNETLADGILSDGLWDVYNNIHMGSCADETAAKYNISREAQDEFAKESYRRAIAANERKAFQNEIVPVTITVGRGSSAKTVTVSEDDEHKKVNFDKMASLKPAFNKDGTVTAANASKLNDGASAVLLMSADKAKELGMKPIARIRGFGDAAQEPKMFTTAPSLAVPRALKMAGVSQKDISLHEINEAFSVVVLANEQILGIDNSIVNVCGGAVAMGHPIGSSGCRIVVTLVNQLASGQLGSASICNGGGGATALIVEKF